MTIRRIAVHLDQGTDCVRRITLAMKLAKLNQAHVTGIYASYPDLTYGRDGSILTAAVLDVFRTKQREAKDRVEMKFIQMGLAESVAVSVREGTGEAADIVATHARNSDFLIIGQENDDDTASVSKSDFIDQVLLTAGRPVVVVPSSGTFSTLGERILCCWNNGREAARALADAAPFLDTAKHLSVLTIDPHGEDNRADKILMEDFASYCTAHNYPVFEALKRNTRDMTAGETILSVAADYDADLIVMGAYGHTRVREWVMGGATASLLRSMTLPVLFSH
jgi:nucleotide-binding universal stress UspA family protein